MCEEKKISVVMCTYNGVRYLQEQLDTILAQTYPIYEIIIQDDGSTDGTFEVLQQYAKQFPQIQVFKNEKKHGINGNFFSAMARATSDYIAISDQDDLWDKNKLRIQAEAIGNKMLCSAFSVPFSTDGFPIKLDMRVPNTHLIRQTYICELPGHSMLFRRELLSYIHNGEDFPLYYDGLILDVAAAAESIVFIPKVLVHFRRHSKAATASQPIDNRLFSGGSLNYVLTSLLYHKKLQGFVRKRFTVILQLLENLPFETKSLKDAIKMSKMQKQHGPMAFLRRTVFFLTHSQILFHSEVKNSIIRLLRAAFFTFSCGYYYRGQLKKRKKLYELSGK